MYMYQNSLKYKYHIQIIFNVDSIAKFKISVVGSVLFDSRTTSDLSMLNERRGDITSYTRIDTV